MLTALGLSIQGTMQHQCQEGNIANLDAEIALYQKCVCGCCAALSSPLFELELRMHRSDCIGLCIRPFLLRLSKSPLNRLPRQYALTATRRQLSLQGGGGFRRGQFHGENFVFHFGVEIFPTKFFSAIWGTSWSLCIVSGGGSQVLLRCCRKSVCSLRPSILLA